MLLLLTLVLYARAVATPAPAALAAFVDAKMAEQFAELDLVGAVVTVVEVGGPTFSKGYGYADLASRVAVDPDRSLFRIGSITKLFVWTAVMQLVDGWGRVGGRPPGPRYNHRRTSPANLA